MSSSDVLAGPVPEVLRAREMEVVAAEPPFRLGYCPELDGLRGVAVLMVLALHASFSWARGGGLGVDLFFVLSGFLITSLLRQEWERRGKIDLRAFYARRALRLIPALTLLLIVYLAYVVVVRPYGIGSGLRVAGIAALYLSNWVFALSSKQLDVLSHTWSLSIEEHFYLVWPLVLIGFLRRADRRATLFAVGGVILLVTVGRHLLWAGGVPMRFLLNSTFTRMDALLMGCLAALAMGWGYLPRSPVMLRGLRWSAWVGAAVLAFMFARVSTDQEYPFFLLVRFTAVPLLAVTLILHLAQRDGAVLGRMFSVAPLVQIGRVSYGIYLWHYPVFMLFRLPGQFWLDLALKLGLTTLLVLASYHWVEQPFLRLKKRFGSG